MRKRHWISAIFEILFPLILVIVASYVQYSNSAGQVVPEPSKDEGWQPPTYFDETKTYAINDLFSNKSYESLQLIYAPNNTFSEGVMKIFQENNPLVTISSLDNEDQLLANMTSSYYNGNLYGIVFLNDENDLYHMNYKIRSKDYYISRVASLTFAVKSSPGPAEIYQGSSEVYETRSNYQFFAKIQIAMNEAYLKYLSNDRKETVVSQLTTHQIAYPKYLKTNSGQ